MHVFDPFTDRRARDIRNRLSEALVRSLRESDPSFYRREGDRWVSSDLAHPYRIYIRDRLFRYDAAFETILSESVSDTVVQAVIIWNEGLFFETHEQLEGIWHDAGGEFREAIKGWIKAAGTYVHLEHGHASAARELASKAVSLLNRHGHTLTLVENLDRLVTALNGLDPDPPRLRYRH